MAPRLNLLSRPALLALLHRALASGSAGSNALTGLRRIELTQEEQTETHKLVSEYGSNLDILRDKAKEARRRAQKSDIDVKLHRAAQPAEGKRGIFGPRQTPEQRSHSKQQILHAELHRQYVQEAEAVAAAADDCEKCLLAARERLKRAKQQHAGLLAALHSELAAKVLDNLLADPAGAQAVEALETLGEARQVARGDLMVGSLFVLCALFGQARLEDGIVPAREMLRDLHLLFSHHNDPAERVLVSWTTLVEAGLRDGIPGPSLSAVGLLAPGNFSCPEHYRLYLLLLVLCGEDRGEAACDDASFSHLLGHCSAALRNEGAALSAVDSKAPLLERVLRGSLLLVEDQRHLIPAAVGVDLDRLELSKGKTPRWPALWDIVSALPADPWPEAALSEWRGALACLLLLAARAHPVSTMYKQWLEESYGWPKSDLYWWTLSTLKDDPALLRNLLGGSYQLFAVAATASPQFVCGS